MTYLLVCWCICWCAGVSAGVLVCLRLHIKADTRSENELRAERLEHDASFQRHGRRHRQDKIVAARCRYHGEADAGVARRWLH